MMYPPEGVLRDEFEDLPCHQDLEVELAAVWASLDAPDAPKP